MSRAGVIVGVALLLVTGCKRDPVPEPAGDGTGTGTAPPAGDSSTTASVVDDTGATTGEPGPPCPARRHALLDEDKCGYTAVGDLDADGVDDLLLLGNTKGFIEPTILPRRIYSYLGGDPLLSAPEVHCCFSSGLMFFATLMDINGDGRQDPLLAAQQSETVGDVGHNFNDLEQLVRGPQGGYVGRRQLVRADDLFGGARPGAAVGNLLSAGPSVAVSSDQALTIYQADGITLVPTPAAPLMFDESIEDLVTIDLDGDELDDVVVLLESRVVLVHSPGDGTLTELGDSVPPVLGPTVLRGQLDGTGSDELLILGPDGLAVGQLADGVVQWASQELGVDEPAALADVDADGDLDLLTTSGSELVAFLGAGDGSFAESPTVVAWGVGEQVVDVGAGDFDGDGTTELVVCDAQGLLVVQTP